MIEAIPKGVAVLTQRIVAVSNGDQFSQYENQGSCHWNCNKLDFQLHGYVVSMSFR